MIINDRQLRVAEKKAEELIASAARLSGTDAAQYEELGLRLREEAEEFKAIRAGDIRAFPMRTLDELPHMVVKARIARGLTQRELAERLGVKEQMVQRDEAGGYDSARFYRLADALDALNYGFAGCIRPKEMTVTVPTTSVGGRQTISGKGVAAESTSTTRSRTALTVTGG